MRESIRSGARFFVAFATIGGKCVRGAGVVKKRCHGRNELVGIDSVSSLFLYIIHVLGLQGSARC